MGKWLSREGLVPDHVASSPALRARQTTLGVCKELRIDEGQIVWDPRIYGGGVQGLLAVLADSPEKAARVMLVGHNPSLEDLVMYLSGDGVEEPEDGKLLPTATVACLAMPDDWDRLEAGSGQVVSITRPRGLQD